MIVATDTIGQSDRNRRLIVLPVIFSSPETSLGFGAAALQYFRTDTAQSTKPSSIRSAVIYTLQNQLFVRLPAQLFFKENKYWISARASYFLYPFEFYGIGNNIDPDEFEPYEARYLELQADFLRRSGNATYIGPKVKFTKYFDIDSDPQSEILTPSIRGINPGTIAGLGFGVIRDERNNVFCPYGGSYMELNLMGYGKYIGSDYDFIDIVLDLRKYFARGKSEIALQFYQNSQAGNVPFYNLAQLGGSKRMRGYFRGAYRDKHFTTFQTEYRYSIFKPIVLAGFGGIGSVSNEMFEDHKWLPSGGMGIRFVVDQEERIRIRVDYAVGRRSSGFYLNINEAF